MEFCLVNQNCYCGKLAKLFSLTQTFQETKENFF